MQSSSIVGSCATGSPGGEGLPFADLPNLSASNRVRLRGINVATALPLPSAEAPIQPAASFFPLFLDLDRMTVVVSDARLKSHRFLFAWPF